MKKNVKRLGTLMLIFCMLCSLLFTGIAIPASAQTTACETFSFDAADNLLSFANGKYTDIQKSGTAENGSGFVDVKALYAAGNLNETVYAAQRAELTKKFGEFVCFTDNGSTNGVPVQADFDFSKYRAGSDWAGFVAYTADQYIWAKGGNTNLGRPHKNTTALVPKDSNGNFIKAKNFEAKVVTRYYASSGSSTVSNNPFGIAVAFRQQTAGKFTNGTQWTMGTDQGIVMLTPTGINYGAGAGLNSTDTYGHTGYTPDFARTMTTHSCHYTFYLRVVGDDLRFKIVQSDYALKNEVVIFDNLDSGDAISLSGYDREGYISFGAMIGKTNEIHIGLKEMQVTKLDANGNPIDVTSAPVNKFTFDATDNNLEYANSQYTNIANDGTAQANPVDMLTLYTASNLNETVYNAHREQLLTKWAEYSTYADNTSTTQTVQTDFDLSKYTLPQQAGFTSHCDDTYLWSSTIGNSANPDRVFKAHAQLAPKDANGNLLKYKNFEATFSARYRNQNGGSTVNHPFGLGLVFRQQEAGKIIQGNTWNMGNNHGIVYYNEKGLSWGAGNQLTGEDTYGDAAYQPDCKAAHTSYTFTMEMTVRVVGQDMKLRVVKNSTDVLFDNFPGGKNVATPISLGELTAEGYIGFVALASKSTVHIGLKDMTITQLDENGNAVDWMTDVGTSTITPKEYFAFDANIGSYTGTAALSDQPAALETLKNAFSHYYIHDGFYDDLPWYDNAVGNWSLSGNKWLVRGDVTAGGNRLAQLNALVPKDSAFNPIKAQNLEMKVQFKFGTDSTTFVAGLRQKTPARFMNSASGVNQEQVLLALNKQYISVKAGSDITAEEFYTTASTYKNYATALGVTLPSEITVCIKAVGEQVTVRVCDLAETTTLFSKTFTVPYTQSGYVTFGMAAGTGSIGNVNITRLNALGQPVDLVDGAVAETVADTFEYTMKDVYDLTNAYGITTNYIGIGNTDNETDAVRKADAAIINNYLDRKFAQYYNQNGTYKQLAFGETKIDPNQTTETASYNQVWQDFLQRGASSSFWNLLNLGTSLVPRNEATGEELVLKNFETTFTWRTESTAASQENHSSVLLQFRQAVPGRYSDNQSNVRRDQGILVLNPYGITVAAGEDITDDLYTTKQIRFDSALPQIVKVTVRVVGDKLWVSVYDQTGEQLLYNHGGKPFAVPYEKTGYIAYGITNRQAGFGDISLTRLDDNGNALDINLDDQKVDAPWDVYPNRHGLVMGAVDTDVAQALDYYYGGVAETMDAHWTLDGEGVLYRQNDLDNLAAMKFNLYGEDETVKGYDATFKLHIDSTKQGTFWVVSGQTDKSKIGKVTATVGGTDYLSGQLAVGFAVGGQITLALGDGAAVTIPAATRGTPSGVHHLRVRVANGNLEVYHNGNLRAVRAIDPSALGEGYLSFGCAGGELGISEARVARVDQFGTAVDFKTIYTDVQAVPDMQIAVTYQASFMKLPETLTVYQGDKEEQSRVYWDLSGVAFGTVGEYVAVGYLESTNGIRANVKITVGKNDPTTTVAYGFSDDQILQRSTAYFLSNITTKDQAAVKVEGTANDTWYVENGLLQAKTNGLYSSSASNMNVLVLDGTYNNFMLDVDFKGSASATSYVGFGATASGTGNVFASQTNGGYALYPTASGTTAAWKLMGVSGGALNTALTTMNFSGYDVTAGALNHHLRLIVNDNKLTVYFDNHLTPQQYTLPNYNGGKVYLALCEPTAYFDNLKVVNLDVKDLHFVGVHGLPDEVIIDREKGDSLPELPAKISCVTDEGYEYEFVAEWDCDSYRSYKAGTHHFVPTVKNLTGLDVSFDADISVKVINNIGNDFDTTASVKYYFDHENDFLDFDSYYSAEKTVPGNAAWDAAYGTYTTAQEGYLVKRGSVAESWQMTANGVTALNPVTPASHDAHHVIQAQNVESVVLKPELNLNLASYKVEFDYRHAQDNLWYPYMLFGVQDPTVFHGKPAALTTGYSINQLETSTDSGCWVWMHQDGGIGMNGAFSAMGTGSLSTNNTSTWIIEDSWKGYVRNDLHHAEAYVFDDMAFIRVDDAGFLEVPIKSGAYGGLAGFAGHNNGVCIDNFQITSIDKTTFNPLTATADTIPLAQAERGWGVEDVWDAYIAYTPSDEDTYFDWSDYVQ